jgi:hypothetical protein
MQAPYHESMSPHLIYVKGVEVKLCKFFKLEQDKDEVYD